MMTSLISVYIQLKLKKNRLVKSKKRFIEQSKVTSVPTFCKVLKRYDQEFRKMKFVWWSSFLTILISSSIQAFNDVSVKTTGSPLGLVRKNESFDISIRGFKIFIPWLSDSSVKFSKSKIKKFPFVVPFERYQKLADMLSFEPYKEPPNSGILSNM